MSISSGSMVGLWCEEQDFRFPPVSLNAVSCMLHTEQVFQSFLSVRWCVFSSKYSLKTINTAIFSVCMNMYVVSKCAFKSFNRVLPRYPFRMGRWTSLNPQNCCWLREPGSLSGRNIICSVPSQVCFINMQDKTDFSFQLHLWICVVLIITMISSFLSLSHPKNALNSHTETHICTTVFYPR